MNEIGLLFEIQSDYEFYCYLKAHLPEDYSIVSEPQPTYYSEWEFNYKVYHKNCLIAEYRGNFLNLDNGLLVTEAKSLLEKIKRGN